MWSAGRFKELRRVRQRIASMSSRARYAWDTSTSNGTQVNNTAPAYVAHNHGSGPCVAGLAVVKKKGSSQNYSVTT